MTTKRFLPFTLVALAVLAACSSVPAGNAQLDEARRDYRAAQENPQARDLASGEMRQAGDALARASDAWTRGDDSAKVNHLAYLARQRVAIAQETGSRKAAELGVAIQAVGRTIETMLGSRVALRGMKAQGFGALYNMEGFGSDGARQLGMSTYGATKCGVRYFTRSPHPMRVAPSNTTVAATPVPPLVSRVPFTSTTSPSRKRCSLPDTWHCSSPRSCAQITCSSWKWGPSGARPSGPCAW